MTDEPDARRPVWEALSSLFLDTDTSLLREQRAEVLARSPYSLDELDVILRDEVFPVCSWNMISVAGEWHGFDPVWLEQTIVDRIRRRRWRLGIGHYFAVRSPEWRHTRAAIDGIRRRRDG